MKTRNVLRHAAISAAVLAACSVANAGTLSGATVFASELFGSSSTAVTLQPGTLTYTFSTPGGIVINNGGTINLYFRLGNGATFTAVPAAGAFALSAGVTLTVGTPVLSTDKTTIVVPLNNASGVNQTIGVGATLTYTPAAGQITNGTSNGTINASASASVAAANVNAATLPSDIDTPAPSAHAWTTVAAAITGAITPSSSFPTGGLGVAETTRIDLTSSNGAGTRFTTPANAGSTTLVNLGAITFTDATGTQNDTAVGTEYTIAGTTGATPLSGTVTGSFKASSAMYLTTGAVSCAAGTKVAAGPDGVANGTSTVFTFSGVTRPTTAVPYFVCYDVSGGSSTGQIPVTQPVAAFTLAKTRATDVSNTANGNLLNLQQNGATVTMRSYLPAALTGYFVVARLINTGTIAAQISVQLVNEDGTTGTSLPIGTPVAPGGVARFNQSAIEAVIGTLPSTARPRLRFSAPTNGLELQTIFNNSNGAYNNISGTE